MMRLELLFHDSVPLKQYLLYYILKCIKQQWRIRNEVKKCEFCEMYDPDHPKSYRRKCGTIKCKLMWDLK